MNDRALEIQSIIDELEAKYCMEYDAVDVPLWIAGAEESGIDLNEFQCELEAAFKESQMNQYLADHSIDAEITLQQITDNEAMFFEASN